MPPLYFGVDGLTFRCYGRKLALVATGIEPGLVTVALISRQFNCKPTKTAGRGFVRLHANAIRVPVPPPAVKLSLQRKVVRVPNRLTVHDGPFGPCAGFQRSLSIFAGGSQFRGSDFRNREGGRLLLYSAQRTDHRRGRLAHLILDKVDHVSSPMVGPVRCLSFSALLSSR